MKHADSPVNITDLFVTARRSQLATIMIKNAIAADMKLMYALYRESLSFLDTTESTALGACIGRITIGIPSS